MNLGIYKQDFESYESAELAIKLYAKENGFAVRKSRNGNAQDERYRFQCTMEGKVNRIENPAYLRTTCCRYNCKYAINLYKDDAGRWVAHSSYLQHNHGPRNSINLALNRQVTPDLAVSVATQAYSVLPMHIQANEVRRDSSVLVKRKDIYNLTQQLRREKLNGSSPLEYVARKFLNSSFVVNSWRDDNKELQGLFFMHKNCIEIVSCSHYVYSMDSTYKTICWDMPLLNIVGQDCFNCSFFAASCFLKSESTQGYLFALSCFKRVLTSIPVPLPDVIFTDRELALVGAIEEVFPNTKNVICSWHLTKMVKRKLENLVPAAAEELMKHFSSLIYANTKEEFKEIWEFIVTSYSKIGEGAVISYFERTWMPHADHWSKAYLHGRLTFGKGASSRAESAHSLLKKWLIHNKGDIDRFIEIYNNMVGYMFAKYKEELNINIYSQKYENVSRFSNVIGQVSIYICDRITEDIKKLQDSKKCACIPIEEMGYHCACKMLKKHKLVISDIHEQFHLPKKTIENLQNPFGNFDASLIEHPKKAISEKNSKGCKAATPHFLTYKRSLKAVDPEPSRSETEKEKIEIRLPKKQRSRKDQHITKNDIYRALNSAHPRMNLLNDKKK